MVADGSRAAGKRQVRPNMARTDFGYVERARTTAKPAKKAKRDEEEEAGNGTDGGAARPARSEKEARSLVSRRPSAS